MFSLPHRLCAAVLFSGMLSFSFSAHAGFVMNSAVQGPKPDLNNPLPPALMPAVQQAIAAFDTQVTFLGGNEYESAPTSASFGYTGGSATAGGNFSMVDGTVASPGLGRYNTTTGLPLIGALVNPGHWLESTGTFSYSMTGAALSAFSFFGTDLGDFDLGLTVALMRNGQSIFTDNINFVASTNNNGNLLFVGVKGDSAADTFDQIIIRVNQAPGAPFLDAVGFDSMRVGVVSATGGQVPEPGSLALAGLALAAAAVSFRRRRPA